MYHLLLIPIVYLAAVLDAGLADVLRIGRATPNLLALAAVVWVLATPGRRAFLVGGGIMLLGDLAAPGRIGVGTAWMLVVAYGITRLRTHVGLDHLAAQVAAVGVAITCWTAGVAVTGRLLGELPMAWTTIAGRAAGVGMYTAGIALPVLMVLGWIREPAVARHSKVGV